MNQKYTTQGYLMAIGAYIIWGFLPLYWKGLHELPAFEILSHRVVWSFALLLLFNLVMGRKDIFAYFKSAKTRRPLYITSILISLNWVIYIFAVNTGHTVDASLGYYINPLVSVILGMIFFKEKLTKTTAVALGLATLGVLYQTISYGKFPWVAISLALTFGVYGLFKKKYALDSINSLMVETLMVTPFCLGYVIFLGIKGEGHIYSGNIQHDALLMLAGLVTSIPLYLFGEGAKRIPLSAIGFLQYIAPTMMLLIGVFFFGEEFTNAHIISFALIWSGLAVYTVSAIRKMKKRKKEEVLIKS
ncbi:EamA family transporter RarD [Sediminitomix flava]|uniref:Chloramphenicol-sensitive protein RarD n=1 Tax=Sediminitomix flava TaxID=379075 RepID=A0A315Z051_SEDFL|nr:EamA family transporter RarD [Sediminitomix flava]PWJ36008.1 chloramphenicol-sensitive protein RarD [Sediminitomix flava]